MQGNYVMHVSLIFVKIFQPVKLYLLKTPTIYYNFSFKKLIREFLLFGGGRGGGVLCR